ncbi:hypothetical protein OHS70_35555 [Streptomyces sp. NBC_00390]|uniref:hypothetical protein n=1 Tax=Streptomyces sp. NBC_00390 TaxID=2975736 RepID=UPI002E2123AB
MTAWQLSTHVMPTTGSTIDPYRFPGADACDPFDEAAGDRGADAFFPPAPEPGQRVQVTLEPADRRRLDLHAALTTAGIAPRPGDLAAIEALCALDDRTNATVQRWITSVQ